MYSLGEARYPYEHKNHDDAHDPPHHAAIQVSAIELEHAGSVSSPPSIRNRHHVSRACGKDRRQLDSAAMTREQELAKFVAWADKNNTGDEKGQAQIFLDRLFQGFGQQGSLDVGGKPEFRIRKSAEDGGGTSFADYVWKPVVLIEMKKRGVNLATHISQAFKYWERLCPDRPRYVVLCNFDEFRIYDFDKQIDAPVDTVTTRELPERYGPLRFLEPGTPKPAFGVDRLQVTREAADKLAACFNKLAKRGVERPVAQRFILQMLVALFAEDIDLLPKYFVAQILDDCAKPADTFDLIGGLFEAMNTRKSATGGRFKDVAYFIKPLPRYADLDRVRPFVASIIITPIGRSPP